VIAVSETRWRRHDLDRRNLLNKAAPQRHPLAAGSPSRHQCFERGQDLGGLITTACRPGTSHRIVSTLTIARPMTMTLAHACPSTQHVRQSFLRNVTEVW